MKTKKGPGAYPIPFHKGGLCHYPGWPEEPTEWRDNYTFVAEIVFQGFRRGRSAAYAEFKDAATGQKQHRYRFDKGHGSEIALDWMLPRHPSLSATGRTSFTMPAKYRGDDAVAAYRRYYVAEKMILRGKPVTWTRRERPAWLLEKV